VDKVFSYERLSGSRISYENSLLTTKQFIYSTTPLLQQTSASRKDPKSPLRGQVRARSSGPGFFTRLSSLHSSLFPRPCFASFVFLIFILLNSYAYSAQVTLRWDPVTHPDLAGYKIYYGNSIRNYYDTTDVGNQTSWTITGLIDTEPYYFAVTAYDIYANESDYSNEVFWQISETADVTAYTPVTPCRMVDTRLAGGTIPPGGIRSYSVRGAVASQGGNSAGCPSPKGEPRAVHVNVTAVPLSGIGYLTAYPYGSTAPLAILVDYKVGVQNVANSGTVKTCFNCAKDINIKSNYGTAHVVIDVLGYYYEKP
jgi:hypothetical protein